MGMINNVKVSPLKGKTSIGYSSDFGWRTLNGKKSYHNGIDLPGQKNSCEEIIAVAHGKVVAVRNNIKGNTSAYPSGNYVTIDHGNGVKTVYCHMLYGSVKVKKGDRVEKGQELGIKGNTGRSTAAHLHFGVNVNGKYVDPKPYLLGTKEFCNSTISYTGAYPTLPKRGYFKLWDRGEEVKKLQRFLNWCLGCKLAIDGCIGPLTMAQIKNFQKKYNLKVDGYFGPACLKKAKEIKLG